MVKKKRNWIQWFKTSVWAFPLILFIVMTLLTALKISGSSVGTYYPRWYGSGTRDPNLLYGHPQAIRSDEWLVNTQRIISQSKNNYSRSNPNMISGSDVSLKEDIPVRYWTTIFRPQNWAYLILPLQNAFTFKWWLPMLVLILGCYFFILRMFPGKILFAALISIAVGLSPFELWWYQTGAFLTIGLGFFMVILVMRLLSGEFALFKNKRLGLVLQVLFLAYAIACFGLIFYPPFQIPIGIVVAFFSIGYLLQKRFNKHIEWKVLAQRVGFIAISIVIAACVGVAFLIAHRSVLNTISGSVYPGHRVVLGGTTKPLSFFNSFVMPLQQSDRRGSHFVGNQSEASNFILLLPFLILPAFALMIREWRVDKRIDWLLLSLQVCALLLFLRVFTGLGQVFFKLMLLHKVPDKRLIIGLGFLGIVQMIYLLRKIKESKISANKLLVWSTAYGLGCFLVLMSVGLNITHHYPLFIHNLFVVAALSAFFAAIITALLAGRMLIFGVLFLGFTILSSFRVMPLYRGLDILTNNKVVIKMAAISKPKDTWVTVGDDAGIYENFGWLAGRTSISGAQIYPSLKFWQQIGGPKYDYIYNRQGHAFFTDNPNMKDPISLTSTDSFIVKFECSPFIEKNVNFALSVHPLELPCVRQVSTVSYPTTVFHMYKVIR